MGQEILERKSKATFRQEIGELYDKNGPMLYRAAKSITANHADAEDALHNAFVKLLEREPSKEFDRNPAGYLYRSVVNEALNILRSRERDNLDDNDISQLEIAVYTDEDTTQQLEDMDRKLMAARAKIDPYLGVLLTLRYETKLSCAEIAKVLRRTRTGILIALKRAERSLQQIMLNTGGAQ